MSENGLVCVAVKREAILAYDSTDASASNTGAPEEGDLG